MVPGKAVRVPVAPTPITLKLVQPVVEGLLLSWVWIAEVTPLTYPSSALVTVLWVGRPFTSETRAFAAVMAGASTMAPEEEMITRLLARVAEELVPPLATGRIPVV